MKIHKTELEELIKTTIRNVFSQKKILVLGDIMVDEYIYGTVERVSPEAPIPVLSYKEKAMFGGGASNVVRNLIALGCSVYLSGVVGDDSQGKWLISNMKEISVDTNGCINEINRPTTVKQRFATKNQQLLRVDNESCEVITQQTQYKIYNFIESNIKNIDAVILSDYRKGVITDLNFVQRIIKLCTDNHVIVSIDSKATDIKAFKGVTFVKPNTLELERAVGIKITDDESLERAGQTYLHNSGAEALILTRSEKGISVFIDAQERQDFPSKAKQVFDVTGAGDTVISTITLALASGLSICDATILGNIAASIVVSKVGTATASVVELLEYQYEE